jgi:hypothetical protein
MVRYVIASNYGDMHQPPQFYKKEFLNYIEGKPKECEMCVSIIKDLEQKCDCEHFSWKSLLNSMDTVCKKYESQNISIDKCTEEQLKYRLLCLVDRIKYSMPNHPPAQEHYEYLFQEANLVRKYNTVHIKELVNQIYDSLDKKEKNKEESMAKDTDVEL